MTTRIVHSVGAVFLTMLFGSGPAWAGADPLYNPDPIPVPNGKNLERVKSDVHKVLLENGWQVKHLGPGRLEAKQIETGRGDKLYVAVIDVKYDVKTVTITYRDSRGLGYNKENNEIDGKYTRWIRKLEKNLVKVLESY